MNDNKTTIDSTVLFTVSWRAIRNTSIQAKSQPGTWPDFAGSQWWWLQTKGGNMFFFILQLTVKRRNKYKIFGLFVWFLRGVEEENVPPCESWPFVTFLFKTTFDVSSSHGTQNSGFWWMLMIETSVVFCKIYWLLLLRYCSGTGSEVLFLLVCLFVCLRGRGSSLVMSIQFLNLPQCDQGLLQSL